eukprot:TRINITY_DN110555_c0_g1_i1.p1 TRINITY_DN110555_c0_g1~~TRINITY_DN110555_c0_g1_i1.p1  ORF type:complete len:290 (-),score=45.66 TRINITY_DN110555_c0_g1_i1:62-895(-)
MALVLPSCVEIPVPDLHFDPDLASLDDVLADRGCEDVQGQVRGYLKVSVQTIAGDTFDVSCEGGHHSTLEELKQKISRCHGGGKWQLQKLIWNGEELQPDTAILGTVFKDEQEVSLLLIKMPPRKVYFTGVLKDDRGNTGEVWLSDAGCEEGDMLCTSTSGDLFTEHPIDGHTVSFESVNHAGLFLTVTKGECFSQQTVALQRPGTDCAEIFRVVPALSRAPAPACSFESLKRPGNFLCHHSGDRAVYCQPPDVHHGVNRISDDNFTWTLIASDKEV